MKKHTHNSKYGSRYEFGLLRSMTTTTKYAKPNKNGAKLPNVGKYHSVEFGTGKGNTLLETN